jgi:hypothetical protein
MFSSAKAIEELAHFGKLFMRTVPGAIISIEKCAGDIEPISIMQEAWFRIKGIPMKFRNKSTAYYAASLVGKPLALGKNYLRHFAYVRVKIGCQDLALVPNSRIWEIKKGFYEFQYSRELFDPSSNAGNKVTIPDDAQGKEGDQGTPKRQRTGLQDSDAGSQSAPPKITENNHPGSYRQNSLHVSPSPRTKDTGKRKRFELESDNPCILDSNLVSPPCIPNKNTHVLHEVHKEVVDALASLPLQDGEGSSTQKEAESYRQFINSLAKSNSDKAFMIQKAYSGLLDPIVENVNGGVGPSDELVDYDSSDSSQTSEAPFLTQGEGILALVIPSPRHELIVVVIPVDGSQPEPDTQEDPLS